jgi:ferredoxin
MRRTVAVPWPGSSPARPAGCAARPAAYAVRAPMAKIHKVSIEEGCISCSLCQDICPEVFRVDDGLDCVVRPDAPEHFVEKAEEIHDAARDCPVEVIKVTEA